MRYYKTISESYIISAGTGAGSGEEITEAEYNSIVDTIRNRPASQDGFCYRLTNNLEWDLYECPAAEDTDPELSAEEALEIIMGGAV